MSEKWRRRGFTPAERDALLLEAGGRCCACGVALASDWHADHVVPFAAGGETDITNGQALCPACNQAKGAGAFMRGRDARQHLELWSAPGGARTDLVDEATGVRVVVVWNPWTPERARAMKDALERRMR